MKKLLFRIFFIIIAASALLPSLSSAQVIPAVTKPVNDYAGIISQVQKEKIAKLLVEHRKKTGVQIAVLTVASTRPMNIEEFSIKTVEKWGGGSKERDDGLLLIVSVQDRRMRIEVGYGLEGYVTDLKAGRILAGIRDDFKKYRYGQGIEKAVAEIITLTGELRPGDEIPASARLRGAFFHGVDNFIIVCIAGILIGIAFILAIRRLKLNFGAGAGLFLFLYIVIPILLQLFLSRFWYWTPIVYITGALAGACIISAITAPKSKGKKTAATVFAAITALACMIPIYYFLHVMKPSEFDTTDNEIYLLIILTCINFIQLLFLIGVNGGFAGESSDSYDYSSSGQSSSGSYNDTDWSGGGGSFGGGGASASW